MEIARLSPENAARTSSSDREQGTEKCESELFPLLCVEGNTPFAAFLPPCNHNPAIYNYLAPWCHRSMYWANNIVLGLFAKQGETNMAHARRDFAYHLEKGLARLVA